MFPQIFTCTPYSVVLRTVKLDRRDLLGTLTQPDNPIRCLAEHPFHVLQQPPLLLRTSHTHSVHEALAMYSCSPPSPYLFCATGMVVRCCHRPKAAPALNFCATSGPLRQGSPSHVAPSGHRAVLASKKSRHSHATTRSYLFRLSRHFRCPVSG